MGEVGEGASTPSEVVIEKPATKELNGVQTYRELLGKCFDEKGNFVQSERVITDRGDTVLKALLTEPVASDFQSLVLGQIPLFFAEYVKHEDDLYQVKRFLELSDGKFDVLIKKHGKFSVEAFAAVYDPEAVSKVVSQNQDIFPPMNDGEDISTYLGRVVHWEDLGLGGSDPNNPMFSFLNAEPYVSEGQIAEEKYGLGISNRYAWWIAVDEIPSMSIASDRAMKKGLLLGYPRELLENLIEKRVRFTKVERKFWGGEANDFWGGEKPLLSDDMFKDVARRRGALKKKYPDLTDEDFDLILERSYYQSARGVPRSQREIVQFNEERDELLEKSGVKDVQAEFVQRYQRLKMKGLTGFLRKMIRKKQLEAPSTSVSD